MLLPLPEPVSHTVRAIWSGRHPIEGDSRQRRGLRAGAGRPLARGPPSVTPLRGFSRSTAGGSSPCCVKCRACPRFAGRCWSVLQQRRIITAGQHQLDDLGRRTLDQIGHSRTRRGSRKMEVIHDDRRARRQPGGVVGDRRGDISRHRPVHRQQADGIGAKAGFDCPRRLDKAGPEPGRFGVGPVTRKPGRHAGWPRRGPVRQQHGLARPSRPRHNSEPLTSSRHQPVMQHGPCDERGGRRRRPELRQREPRAPQGAASSCHAVIGLRRRGPVITLRR